MVLLIGQIKPDFKDIAREGQKQTTEVVRMAGQH
jgi:hypothetical protein